MLQKPKGLSDALYTSCILSGLAHDHKFDEGLGVTTVMNMRPFLKYKPTLREGVSLVLLPVSGKANLDTRISEFMKRMRNNFNESVQNGLQFGYLQDFMKPMQHVKSIPGTGFSITNVGQIRVDGPFNDFAIVSSTKSSTGFPFCTVIHYATINENQNEIHTGFQYEPSTISEREAKLILNSIVYGLENIKMSDSFGVALEKMEAFQSNYIRNEFPKYVY